MPKDSRKIGLSPGDPGRSEPSPPPEGESQAGPIEEFSGFFDQTTEYIRDPATGRWIVKNPAGSTAYNSLYHSRRGEPWRFDPP